VGFGVWCFSVVLQEAAGMHKIASNSEKWTVYKQNSPLWGLAYLAAWGEPAPILE
jgi:hypothetical protein